MNWIRNLIVTGSVVLATAAPARADIFVSPAIGIATKGLVDGSKVTFGAQAGVIGTGPIGFEIDYGYTAKARAGTGTDNFRTIGVALLYAPGFAGSDKFRTYVAAGAGLIGAVTEVSHIYSFGGDEVRSATVVSAGGGVLMYLSNNFGIRLDARYFQALVENEGPAGSTRRSPTFIRATGGLVVKF